MTDGDTQQLLHETIRQLERIAESQERLEHQLERGAAERHAELMRALGRIVEALDKIERTQYG